MTTTLKRCQYLDGFILVGPARNVVSMPAAIVSIAKGDLLFDDNGGYLTNASITTFDDIGKKFYIAIEPCDNSAGSLGDLNVLCVICDDPSNQFWAKVEAQSVIARSDVGTIVECESEDGIDVDEGATKELGFLIEGFDAGAAAVAANTYGYALGRFVVIGETT